MSLRDRVAYYGGAWGWWRDPYKPSEETQARAADLLLRVQIARQDVADLTRQTVTPCDTGDHYGCTGCGCTCHPRSER